MAALVAVGVTFLLWYRLGPAARGTAWAEDGDYFLRDRLQLGPVASIWEQYAGYFQLVPRLVTDLAVAAGPIDRYVVLETAVSCCVVGMCCAAVGILAAEHVRSWPLRFVIAIAPGVLPLMPYEIAGNAANLHWFLLWLSPWLFLARPRTCAGIVGVTVLVIVAVMSEIQTAIFTPLLLFTVLQRRGRGQVSVVPRMIPIVVAAMLCLAAQAVNAATHPRPSNHFPWWSARDLTQAYLLQVVGGSFTSNFHVVAAATFNRGWWLLAVPAVALLVVIVLGALAASWRCRLLIVALTAASPIIWTLSVQLNRWVNWSSLTHTEIVALPPVRYAAAASLLLVTAALVASAELLRPLLHLSPRAGSPRLAMGILGAVTAATFLVIGVTSAAPVPTIRSGGPNWSSQVDAARTRCQDTSAGSVFIGAAPNPAVWGTEVPCTVLVPGSGR